MIDLPDRPVYALWGDPGVTTGLALYPIGVDDIPWVTELDFPSLVAELDEILFKIGPVTMVGAERFVITADSHRRDGSLEAIQGWGAIKAAAVRHRAMGMIESQSSSMALSFCTDDLLRALGWYNPGLDHANDATRHLVRWLSQNRLMTTRQRTVLLEMLHVD